MQRQYRAAVANSFLLLLCVSAGMFVSSTGFLPSSFTMYALTAAAAAVLEGRPYPAIAAAVIGAIPCLNDEFSACPIFPALWLPI